VPTYNPDDYIVSFLGIPISGFAKGSFIKIARQTPNAKLKIGAQGDPLVVLSNDKSVVATLTLQASSSSNDDLSVAAQKFEAQIVRGDGIGPFQMSDINSDTLAHGSIAFISKYPSIEGNEDSADLEWEITIADATDFFVGGTAA
jgi:hypothetical protein